MKYSGFLFSNLKQRICFSIEKRGERKMYKFLVSSFETFLKFQFLARSLCEMTVDDH